MKHTLVWPSFIATIAFVVWGLAMIVSLHGAHRQRDAAIARADSLQAVVTRWDAACPPGSVGRSTYQEIELDSTAGSPHGWKR